MAILSTSGVLRKVLAFKTPQGIIMKTLISTLILGFCLAITGCNTIKGAGQDIQKAGEKIEDAAKKK
jgi:predicted small secreted protein